MAKSVNKVILLGNVGKDPEIRSTGGGTMVANFSLATSDRFQDPQGNWQDRTEWHNLVASSALPEIIRDYVKKGSKLYIEGKIQTRNWDDKETGGKEIPHGDHRQRTVVAFGPRGGRRLQPLIECVVQHGPAPTRGIDESRRLPKSPTTISRSKSRDRGTKGPRTPLGFPHLQLSTKTGAPSSTLG